MSEYKSPAGEVADAIGCTIIVVTLIVAVVVLILTGHL